METPYQTTQIETYWQWIRWSMRNKSALDQSVEKNPSEEWVTYKHNKNKCLLHRLIQDKFVFGNSIHNIQFSNTADTKYIRITYMIFWCLIWVVLVLCIVLILPILSILWYITHNTQSTIIHTVVYYPY